MKKIKLENIHSKDTSFFEVMHKSFYTMRIKSMIKTEDFRKEMLLRYQIILQNYELVEGVAFYSFPKL